jgi:D-amino peptidase
MKRHVLVGFACAALVGALAAPLPASAQAKAGPRVYISVDMEGIWGVVAAEQTTSTSPEYAAARRWMAVDVNAVVAGLLDAGAGEIVVNDSHGSMRNIVADTLNPKVSLVSGAPKPLSMMQGIDASFDAAIFVGYHARAGTEQATLDHTISSATVRAIKVNGQEMPELGLNALIAGYYKVPVIMLSGDTTTCAQAKSVLGSGLVTAAVKEATGRVAARLYPQEQARARLREAARDALGKRGAFQPFRLPGPFVVDVEFQNSQQSELPMLLPGVTRTSARSVAVTGADYIETFKLVRAIIALAGI